MSETTGAVPEDSSVPPVNPPAQADQVPEAANGALSHEASQHEADPAAQSSEPAAAAAAPSEQQEAPGSEQSPEKAKSQAGDEEVQPPTESVDQYEEVEEEVDEPVPPEDLEDLRAQAEANGKDPNEVPVTKKVIKKVKKLIVKPSSPVANADEVPESAAVKTGVVITQETREKIQWIMEMLEKGLNAFDEKLWGEELDNQVNSFLTQSEHKNAFFWVEKEGLKLSFIDPPILSEESYDPDFAFFIKYQNETIVKYDVSSIEEYISYGTVQQNYIQSLLKLMDDVYNPQIYSDSTWPENVKKEFIAQLHKFMATLTEASQQSEGYTKLYIPKEDLSDTQATSLDKDLIQRLETTLIYWYRQIKEIVNNQDSQQDSENAGPQDEIIYWRRRKNNLQNIQRQLVNPDLQRIIQILKIVDSSYVPSFEELAKNINSGFVEAENNLDFLNSLFDSCRQLEKATPREIPSILPSLLNRVRMIWEHSDYYNSQERISGLLHKISNEIIKRCKSQINISDMLDGDVEKCIQDLQDSIECGKKWKKIYERTSALINKRRKESASKRAWDFNHNSIFAQMEAFVQRCTELTEICEGQLQFAGKGANNQIPQFGGSIGPEIENILEEIKESFKKHIDRIRATDKERILDVKASNWHDLFNMFKNGMKDLDVMYQNIINTGFEQVSTVHQGVEMLEAFDYLAKRDSIRMAVKKKASEVISMFVAELDKAKLEYDNMKKNMALLNFPLHHGKYSGQAIWVRAQIHRIQRMKESVERLYFIDDTIKRAAFDKYDSIFQTFKQFIVHVKFKEWKDENKDLEEIPLGPKFLDKSVLLRPDDHNAELKIKENLRSKEGHLESNFDRQLEKLMHEVVAWKKLINFGVVVPSYADEFTTLHKENLRILKEYVMLVVREQNKIIDYMDPMEKNLFKDHYNQTEKVIQPGLLKLKWSSKGILENFVRECRRSCNEIYNKLKMFKGNTEKIEQKCSEITSRVLIKIDKKRTIEIRLFEEEQEKHRRDMQNKIKSALDEIKRILSETYEPFLQNGQDIQKVWFTYVAMIDSKIEESLKKAVKNSLLELYRVVGDDKNPATSIFRLSQEIDSSGVPPALVFRPSEEYLMQMVRATMSSMTEILKDFKRMQVIMSQERRDKLEELRLLKEKEMKNNPMMLQQQRKGIDNNSLIEEQFLKEDYFQAISGDQDVKKYSEKILFNLAKTCEKLTRGDLLDPWRQKSFFWESEPQMKHKFAKSILDRDEDITNIRDHIEKLEISASDIQAQKTTDKQDCIVIDNTNIKSSIVDILIQWQAALLNAVQEKAVSDLNSLHALFQNSEAHLEPTPLDIHHLKKNMDSLSKLKKDKPEIEAKLQPLEEKFKLLEDYQINLKEDEIYRKNTLREAWMKFGDMLERMEVRNQKVYNDLYQDTMKNLDDFMKEASDNKITFMANAPFQVGNLSNEKAFVVLNEYKENVKGLREREKEMRFGFDLFSINYAPSPELESVEKEIANLQDVWKTKDDWDREWEKNKIIKFREFNNEVLDDLADDYQTKINAYPKEMKKWEVVNAVRNNVEQFRQTLPLIKMLGEKFMRQRHWDKLQKHLGTILDYDSDSFTLQEIFKINLLTYADSVREVCEVAREEYKIEFALATIDQKWQTLEMVMDEHKKGYYKVKKADDIFSTLEDHMGVLSAQKTTLFYESFKTDIETWETILQNILETLEALLQVQRQWIYLESIFASQQNEQDKQLVGDIAKFGKIEKQLQKYMADIYATRNVKTALCQEGFLTELLEMSKKLDESQKILFQLLERNRKEFPRFYFLSNDDLFEILGNSKDPSKVNKHIKKCFEGIKKLQINSVMGQNVKGRPQENHEVVTMLSPDGEKVSLASKVMCEYGVEKWLKQVELRMVETLKKELAKAHAGIKKKEGYRWVEKWIPSWPGQLLIVASQLHWTNDCGSVLHQISNSDKADKHKAWKPVKDDKTHFLAELTKLVRKPASETDRLKLIALITIEVHAKDIIESLQKTCFSDTSFDWLKQLRFYSNVQGDSMEVEIKQTNTKFLYGYEYQGNNGRLVITALTDRCYMTLTTAMKLNKGGAPQGPAGTGKTETVKDLGKGMGKFVLVFNCSEGLDYKSIGRMFSGLIQTGGWGCFDEFNRIEVEVLSVVAQQMHSIMNALRRLGEDREQNTFDFEEEVIAINEQVAIFITMNPGYAGRSELPDNLKSLFRPISMMVPDTTIICEIMLQSEGFKNGRPLSIKMVTLYNLMTQQLSKQDHYDFGLRAIKSVLNCAGAIRRNDTSGDTAANKDKEREKELETEENMKEQKILMRAINDMNLPKFIQEDIFLFNALFNDLFPNTDLPESENAKLYEAIENELKNEKLIPKPEMINKAIQLFDSKNTRHGNMLVGKSLSGKTTTWKMLQKAMTTLNKQQVSDKVANPTFPAVRVEVVNPKTVTLNELFGFVDHSTLEWNEGVLSSMMSRLCKDESLDQRWMILDGPVDTLWIESMNTVLDDNKVLTLLNGDRISLPTQVGLVFEVEDLSVASPATVSRAGMIYIDQNDLGWKPYIEAWIGKMKDLDVQDFFFDLVDKWIPRLFKTRGLCKDLVPCSDINIVIALCRLMDSFIKMESTTIGLDLPNKNEIYYALMEKWFTFALIWSFGAPVDEDGRKLVDYHMRDIESIFPHSNTVYDYYINIDKNEWASWEDKINASVWKPGPGMPYHKMLVPTVDSARNRFVIQTLLKNRINILIVGNTGTGKTAVINGILSELDDSYTSMNIVFSSQTNSLKTQEMIESKLVRRTKYKMIPDGKKMVIFVDDLNMPRKDQFGSQPPLELFRQWIDYEGWFDRQSRDLFKSIIDIQFIAAMGPPGGGRAQISKRTQGKFNLINFTFPTDAQVRRIFQSILNHKFQEFEEEIKPLAEPVAQATLNLFRAVSESFLPTPKKSHYVFNLRDISKVIQGVYMMDRFYCDSKMTIFRLWVHECLRVFHDRLISFEDRSQLKKLISDQLEQTLGSNMKECTNDEEQDTIFVDFMEQSSGKPVYIESSYKERGLLKTAVEAKLDEYNKKQRSPMPIVLFEEAISYVCKIHRIIKLGKGHGLLVGEGGSGRHSLTRLAAFMADYELWQVEISRNYRVKEFRDDIKRWSEDAGYKGKSGVFLFSDNQIINEGFIEDINNILTVGEVPNLFSQKDDYPQIKEKMRKKYIEYHQLEKEARIFDEDLIDFFFTRVQNNFHLMLCMSKTGDSLRNYTRMYPGLVNNTTIIWYMPWPEEALLEVANKYLKPLTLQDKIVEVPLKPQTPATAAVAGVAAPAPAPTGKEVKDPKKIAEEEAKLAEELAEEERREGLRKAIATFFSLAHTRVLKMSEEMYSQLKRLYYVTPTNYIELVKGYVEMLEAKQKEYGNEITKLRLGLHKLDEAGESSETLKQQLQISQIQLQKSQKEVEDLMIKIEGESREVNEKQKYVEQKTVLVEKEKGEILRISADAEQDLQAAMPALRMAEEGLANLNKNKLAEVKSFVTPPAGIDIVLSAIMILLLKDPSWASAKKELAAPDFLMKLQTIEKDKISQKTLLKIEKLTHDPKMSIEKIQTVSDAGASMWRWVLAMEMYAKAFKDIEPKRIKVNQLNERLKKSEEELQNLQDNLSKLQEKIHILQQQLEQAKTDKQNLEDQNKVLQDKQERAEKLISGLEGTKEGWKDRKVIFEQKFEFLIGDSLMSAAFMSYAGPFPSEYRRAFVKDALLGQVRNLKISHSKDYNFPDFLVKPITFLNWNFKGLPDDQFSKENAVLVTKSSRFPLMIDPQQQANTWIKNTERDLDKEKLQIIDPQTDNYITLLERAISWGQVVILQNLDEELDPSLEPILNKSLKKVTGGILLCLGADKEIKYNPDFRFYMTTKLANPRYKAEVSTRVTLVNFAVKEEGLQDQLISVVIQKMEANLEKQKNDLVRKKADNESKLKDLDEKILRMLQETKGQLIDDLDLIKALQIAKETEEDVRHQIETGAAQMTKTMNLRKNYVSLATTASKLFFVINEFALINNMYQFSLESYIYLFQRTIDNFINKSAAVNDSLNDKLLQISERHKEEIYKYACRGLFESDKLLLSIQMAVRLSAEINLEEFNFFLRGSDGVVDRKAQPPNANPDWITQQSWDTICDLDKMGNFTGIIGAFTHNSKEWKRWYMSSTPESDGLPGEWDTKCDHLRKLIIVKTIRPDRVIFSATQFVENKIGSAYVQSPSFTFESLFSDSTKTSPVIFILSVGVDPFNQLQQFADLKNSQLVPVSLGQGQSRKAREKVAEGCKNGYWLYLANCHLSLSFLKELEKIIENLEQNKGDIHDNFRLWLSSSPHPKFPISILQKCVKVTTEPSKGVKSNMLRLFNNMPLDKYQTLRLNNKSYYKKLVYSLCWFHSIIVERKRFKQLGWNVSYDFNDSDWETADNILQMYVDQSVAADKSAPPPQPSGGQQGEPAVQNKSPPWDAIRFLISDVTYGGRVTDDWDRRLLNVYATSFFCDKVLFEEKHKLGELTQQQYFIPEELNIKDLKNLEKTGSELTYYKGKIDDFPGVERPETFGQHINAEISSQIISSNALIDSIISLSPQTISAAGVSKESKVANIIKEMLEQIPELIDVEEVKRNTSAYDEGNPLRVVLNQEIDRYNKLLVFVRQSLVNLDKGIQGIQLISEDLEVVLDSLFDGRVPNSWKYCYYSLKPLASWIEDLIKRIDQLRVWGEKNQQPNVFWISGFSFPTGFTTALLQQSARKLRVPIDQFGWDFSFLPYDTHLSTPAKEGAYISGLYLEGAKWDGDKNYIIDAEPMKLHYQMPIILFKPVYFEGKQKQKKGESKYACPTYIFPLRTGFREKPSYMFTVMLPIKPNPSAQGSSDQDFWVKRGTALLMSLAD